MKLIREYRTGKMNTRVYEQEKIRNGSSAVDCLFGIAALESLQVSYIALRDTEHSADEGNGSRQFSPDASAGEVLKALEACPGARLYLAGKYKRANAGIGIDQHSGEVSVTMYATQREHMEELTAEIAGLTAG